MLRKIVSPLITLICIITGCAPVYKIPTKTAKIGKTPVIRILVGKTDAAEVKGNNISVKNESGSAKGNSIKATINSIQLDGKTLNTQFPVEITSENNILEFNGKKLRGDLIIYNNSKLGLLTVNRIDIENYLKGVVPCELRTDEIEALKAQIIASRSFALRLIKPDTAYYDITSGVEAQVYKGMPAEVEFINKTIDETRGLVCTYNGKIIEAKFFSNCGGRTASGGASYLKSIQCQFCKEYPNYRWEYEYEKEKFFDKLGTKGNSATIVKKDNSGRVEELEVTGSDCVIKGEQVRAKLGLKSRFFDMEDKGDKIKINGKGYGHGIGLCQFGAVGMAKKGFDYKSILRYYYSGIKIERLY